MSDSATKKRPQFRNINVLQLLKYRLPLAGRLSILHRVSGALMFLLLPVILAFFAMSMSPDRIRGVCGSGKLSSRKDCFFGLDMGIPAPFLCGYSVLSA